MRHLLTLETNQVILVDRHERSWNIVEGESEGGLSHGTYEEISPLQVGAPVSLKLRSVSYPCALTFARVREIKDITAVRETGQ